MQGNPPSDSMTVALSALAATLSDDKRAERLLALTGLDGDAIRARLGDPGMLAACLSFLEAHEPDLVAVAGDIGVAPARLVAARQELDA